MSPVLAAAFQFSASWLLEVLVLVAIYAVLAASLNFVTGCAGMFSLGHQGFFAVGAYASGWLASVWHPAAGSPEALLAYAAGAGLAIGAASVAGLLVGLPCLRLRGDYLAIATLAFAEIVRIAIQNSAPLGGALGLFVPRLLLEPAGRVEGFRFLYVGLGGVALLATLWVLRSVLRSAHGRAIVSLREDEVASEILGVRTSRYKLLAFVLGAAFAGLAGSLYAHYNGTITPLDFDLMVGIKILLIAVLGGLGSLSGSFVAALLLVGVERLLLTGVFGETVKDWMPVEYALLLILLMLLRPEGLLGRREISDLFRRRTPRECP